MIYVFVKRAEGVEINFASFGGGEHSTEVGINLGCMAYGGIFAVTLLGFACYTNGVTFQNITSNENLRKKWNSRRARQGNKLSPVNPSFCEKLRYFYWEPLPQSRIETYFKILEQAGISPDEAESRISQSIAVGADQEMSVSGDIAFKEVDNKTVLVDYGIDIIKEQPAT